MQLEQGLRVQAAVDRAEHLADLTAEQGQNTDHNNGDQDQNQCVLDQTLTVLLSEEAS